MQMNEKEAMKHKKHICLGILAHVDAGKTTLSESMLYVSGSIRKLGRVDKGDAFLDHYALERERGITIFSKQAVLEHRDMEVTLLDTPGHVDFSAETERTLQVLDYAVLVINGADGVQGHSRTLWRLLARYEIPVFLFINKMDQKGTSKERLLKELKDRLDDACVDFDASQPSGTFWENIAVCDEDVLEHYLEEDQIGEDEIVRLICQRKVFPCYFGSALCLDGVEALLDGLERWTKERQYPDTFGAKVYKIGRDAQGNRLTYLKITGGSLKVKTALAIADAGGETQEEKINQIRIYSGAKYQVVNEVQAGTVCAVTGLLHTHAGQGLGAETASELPVLEPVLSYRIGFPPEWEVHHVLSKLRQLEEEEPQLHIVWDETLGEIHAKLMGEIQIEILTSLMKERFGIPVSFESGSIVYKETIAGPVEGVGHFEPLRHYAEVHLLLEPLEPGSGLVFDTCCSEDMLDRNWQRLILTHLEEKEHPGVLIGASITDMKLTLVAGRAHQKHTEGGDFRQATYRAVRQGLKKAKSVLLEPYYDFHLELPPENLGRAMADIQKMSGTFAQPDGDGETAILMGKAPVAAMRDYQREVIAYTRGRGRLLCSFGGYAPCHNEAEIISASGYDAERDLENPTGSVFCVHGAGYVVPWNQVEQFMHIDSGIRRTEGKENPGEEAYAGEPVYLADGVNSSGSTEDGGKDGWASEKELEEIFARTYGPVQRKRHMPARTVCAPVRETVYKGTKKQQQEEYLLVDGYNIIFAWDELKTLAGQNIDGARDRLKDILCNYQGFRKCTLILVFDAYRVEGHREETVRYHNIHVVYTKEAETADQYIERTVHTLGKKYQVTVATSDGLEQVIIMGQGARRLSAQGLKEEIEWASRQGQEEYGQRPRAARTFLGEYIPEELFGKNKENGG